MDIVILCSGKWGIGLIGLHPCEADYNLAICTIGLQWRSALYASETHRWLNQGQYGSRPHRIAHDPICIEEFQLEISRATRKSLLQTYYDATACYDRIIPSLASIVSWKLGVPESVVLSNMDTLLKAKYRLKTELGISNEFYQYTNNFPISGTGQGSGNSPMIWCFLSSVLFECYETQANGAEYELPDGSGNTKVYMVGYVDDSNGQTNSFTANTQPVDLKIITKACQDAQAWHDVLGASGGALELSKCSYQLLSWMFATDGTPYLTLPIPESQVLPTKISPDDTATKCSWMETAVSRTLFSGMGTPTQQTHLQQLTATRPRTYGPNGHYKTHRGSVVSGRHHGIMDAMVPVMATSKPSHSWEEYAG
jgi:hypothetical protein